MTETNKPNIPSKKEIADELQSKAQAASSQLKEKSDEQLHEYGSQAAGSMESVAEAAQRAADSLSESNQTMLSHYVSELAGGISDLASSLRDKNTDEILHDVSRIARENAGLFLLGSVAIGFGLARIAKAGESHRGTEQGWEGYYGVGSADYEESYGSSASESSGSGYASSTPSRESSSQSSRSSSASSSSASTSSGSGSSSSSGSGKQSSFSETDAEARRTNQDRSANPQTHADTSYMPEEGSGASTSQQSTTGGSMTESRNKPKSGGNAQRPV